MPASAKLVDHIGAQQPRVGGQVDPEVLLRRVVRDPMDKIRTQQRLAAHVGEHPAAGAMQPIDGALRCVFGHSLHFVVEGPAVVAIEIALELGEEISDERMEIACGHTRADIGEEPALHRVVDLPGRLFPLWRRAPSGLSSIGPSKSGYCGKTGAGNVWGSPTGTSPIGAAGDCVRRLCSGTSRRKFEVCSVTCSTGIGSPPWSQTFSIATICLLDSSRVSFSSVHMVRQFSVKSGQRESTEKKEHHLEFNKRRCGVPTEAMPANDQAANLLAS